jgi:hypothetical protein
MSIYEPLGIYLSNTGKRTVNLSFTKIEKIINRKLPPSLYDYPAAWYGTAEGSPNHRWKVIWNNYGYKVENVDLCNQNVTFCRKE